MQIKEYVTFLEQERRSQLTIKNHEYILKNFLEVYGEPDQNTLDDFKTKKIGKQKKKYSAQTENTIRSVLRNYLKFVGQEILAKTIKNVPIKHKMADALTREQVKTLIQTPVSTRPELQRRNKLIIEFLYASGVRVSELSKLNQSDLNILEGLARVRGGKGSIDRDVLLSKNWIKEYLEEYGSIDPENPKALFSSQTGKRISIRQLRNIVYQASFNSGVMISNDRFVSPHKIRSTSGTHVQEETGDIYAAKQFLGHSKIETTLRYVRFDKERLKKIKNPLDELKK